MSQIVTRFAPSPTGYLHVGGARTALFNWLLARHTGGKFLLRIEDTDRERSTEQATTQLLDDLKWLGLNWDNTELVYQSKRLDRYNAIIDDLIHKGLAYKAYESAEELDNQRKQAERARRAYIYRRPKLTDAQIQEFEDAGRPHVVRFAMPMQDYRFDDAVLGPNQGVAASQVQDFIIRRSDGMPTYHFAVVVDDADMGITHILRGQEHLLNTVNHIALQAALGYARPIYAHLNVILSPDTREKLSKRDRDRKIRQRANEWMKRTRGSAATLAAATGIPEPRLADWLASEKKQLDLSEQPLVMNVVGLAESDLPEIMVYDFRKNGFLPEVLNNFLALLGWSPGGDRERMSIDEMVRLFSIEGLGKANASFDRTKLVAFNTEAAAAATPERLLRGFREYLQVNPDSPMKDEGDEALLKVLHMAAGFRTFREVDTKARFLFMTDEAIAYDPSALEKVLKKNDGQGAAILREARELLAAQNDWLAAALETLLHGYAEKKQANLGAIAQPLRVAVSGSTVSPPIYQTLEFLGKDHTIARIDRCLAAL